MQVDSELVELGNTKGLLRGRTTTPSSGRTTTPSLHRPFGLTPRELVFDRSLTFRARWVYQIMAYMRTGAYVNIGERKLAHMAGIDRRSLRNDIDLLIQAGRVERIQASERVRARYLLVDIPAILAFLDDKHAGAAADKAAREAFTRPLVECPKCGKQSGGLLKDKGWCRRCDRKVEMEDVARRAVREEIAAVEKLA